MSKSKRSKICKTLSKPSCDVKDMLLQHDLNVLYQQNRAKKHKKKLAKKAKRDAKKLEQVLENFIYLLLLLFVV